MMEKEFIIFKVFLCVLCVFAVNMPVNLRG